MTDKKRFRENSDVDVAFHVRDKSHPPGIHEKHSEKLQKHFSTRPVGNFGVPNTIVYNEE